MRIDLTTEPLGEGSDGAPVYLKDIWPTSKEISALIRSSVNSEMFAKRYGDVFKGDERWRDIGSGGAVTYGWEEASTYVRNPPYFDNMSSAPAPVSDIENARILGLFLDSITTDHISPAGAIKRTEGGVTVHQPSGEQMPIYDAAMRYQSEGVPLVVFGGRDYGAGSSRDWAAKGTTLLGVRAVIVQSFERIHRSNLIGMGVLPLQFSDETSWQDLGITGAETVSISGLADINPRATLQAEITFADGSTKSAALLVRIDTEDELAYYANGGILQYVLRNLAKAA
jgi:aconitate hydratase